MNAASMHFAATHNTVPAANDMLWSLVYQLSTKFNVLLSSERKHRVQPHVQHILELRQIQVCTTPLVDSIPRNPSSPLLEMRPHNYHPE